MPGWCCAALFLFSLRSSRSVAAAEADVVLDVAERYVRMQTQGLPGQVRITMGRLDTERLPPCTAHEAYAPPGTRMSGRTHIGVRCLAPNIWSVLVPVQIAVTGNYVVTTRPLMPVRPSRLRMTCHPLRRHRQPANRNHLDTGAASARPCGRPGCRPALARRSIGGAAGHSPGADRARHFARHGFCCEQRRQGDDQCQRWTGRTGAHDFRTDHQRDCPRRRQRGNQFLP
jgi:hypothetical protein